MLVFVFLTKSNNELNNSIKFFPGNLFINLLEIFILFPKIYLLGS